MGKSQRTKGAAGERELANLLSEQLGQVVERELSQTRDGGCDMVVESSAGLVHVECKRVERRSPDIYNWLGQCEASCTNGELAAVAWRPNRRSWTVTMDLADWCTLVREAQPTGGDDAGE